MTDAYDMGDVDQGKPWVDPDPEQCPVIPLGYEGPRVVFALPGGELRFELASKIAGMLRTDIFVCVEGQAFLSFWNEKSGDGTKFNAQSAAIWFNRQCRDAGKWDRNRPVRGYGLWPGEKGPVLHVGDALVRGLDGGAPEWTPIAQALREDPRGPVWRLAPPAPRPDKPASVEDGRQLMRLLDMWIWRLLGEEGLSERDVALAWEGVALMGALPAFRPHLMVVGGAGCGKTTLARLMHAAASALSGNLLDSFSEAGLRNGLSGEARAIFLDEAEPSRDGLGPVEKALEVLRRMSTGDGGHRLQGDVGGGTVAQSAVGSAFLGAINPVKLSDAMASRVVQVRLKPLGPAKGGADQRIEDAIAWATEMSPRFLARAIAHHGRFKSDLRMMKQALGEGGQLPRGADLVAALAAGRRMLLHDEALTLETAREEATLWAPLVAARAVTGMAANAGEACLQRIFAIGSGKYNHDRHLSLGAMILEDVQGPDQPNRKALLDAGLMIKRVHPDDGESGPWLLIANSHPFLERGLAGTDFQDWRGSLEHLADLGPEYEPRTCAHPQRFGLLKQRALAIPLTPWLERPTAVRAGEATPFDPPADPVWDAGRGPASHSPSQGERHDW